MCKMCYFFVTAGMAVLTMQGQLYQKNIGWKRQMLRKSQILVGAK